MYDNKFSGTISVEQTLQILFVRYGREKLDAENEAKFVRARAEVADGHAKTVLDTAEKHRTEAEDLLKLGARARPARPAAFDDALNRRRRARRQRRPQVLQADRDGRL